ncbi:MAG TPA: carboxypeptidase-like regulatory domain-containing protein, partial [Polyangiaceae bacterium]
TASASGLPCDVATYLAAKCTGCHGNPPLPSALAGLVTYDDLKATSKEDPTKNEAELSVARMKSATSPMPPGALPSAADVAILQDFINAGYPKGSCGGGGSAGDGGTVVPLPPSTVFKDAPVFALRTGPRAHNAGKDCMSCHLNGSGEAPQFSLGGTVYDGSGGPVSGAEVRLVDAKGKATSVYTGTNGTFYMQGSGFAAPAQVGVRNASGARDMISALKAAGGGACSSCHCTGGSCTVPPIHLP